MHALAPSRIPERGALALAPAQRTPRHVLATEAPSSGGAFALFLRELHHIPPQSQSQQVALEQRAQRGDRDAVHRLTEANLRLVVSMAKRYSRRGLPLEDLVQEGSIGLFQAIQRFDWRRGNSLATFAAWWIRQAIIRAVTTQGHLIQLPAHAREDLARMRTAEDRFLQTTGRLPTTVELSGCAGLTTHRIEALRRGSLAPVSLDAARAGDEEDATLGDTLADRSASAPDDVIVARELKATLHRLIAQVLSDTERRVVELRYGLSDGEPNDIKHVAVQMHVSMRRAARAERRAMAKLRWSRAARALWAHREA